MSKETILELKNRMVIFYAGEPHFAGDILKQKIGWYLLRDPYRYPAALEAQAIRDRMYEALLAGNVDAFGSWMGSYWQAMIRHIGPQVTTPLINRVLEETKDLIIGGKVSGAGGGGFFIIIAKKGKTEELKERLEKIFKATKGKVYSFDFDFEGITVDKRPIDSNGVASAGESTDASGIIRRPVPEPIENLSPKTQMAIQEAA